MAAQDFSYEAEGEEFGGAAVGRLTPSPASLNLHFTLQFSLTSLGAHLQS